MSHHFKLQNHFKNQCLHPRNPHQHLHVSKWYSKVDVASISLPKFSPSVASLLESGRIIEEYDKLIEECAYHLLAVADIKGRDEYAEFGRRMFQQYPCIKVNEGSSPWTIFNTKLSQKIRSVRCKRKKRSENGPMRSKRKQTSNFARIDVMPDEETMSHEDAIKVLKEEYMKPKIEQDRALILKVQRSTLKRRRKWILNLDKTSVGQIVELYPFLKEATCIDKEFALLYPELKTDKLDEAWLEMLTKLDKILGIQVQENVDDDDEMNELDDRRAIGIIDRVSQKINYRNKTKIEPPISVINALDLTGNLKKNSPPRLVINNDYKTAFVLVDEIAVSVENKTLPEMLLLLLQCYYVWNLNYPKLYQILGFLQLHLLKDGTAFEK